MAQSHHSLNTINAGRTYDSEAAWGEFGWVNGNPTDSAAAGTALGTGVKTQNGVIGYDALTDGNRLNTAGEQALAVGKKVGLVTSVPFNHATPAGFIAHNTDRWDNHGIATEMIDSGVDVIIGAGHPNYTDNNVSRASHFGQGSWISQTDFERLLSGETPFTYIDSKSQFENVAAGNNVPEKLFGLARVAETFQYNRSGLTTNTEVTPFTDPLNTDVPSLVTSTQAALNVLEGDEGFFLMVEGGAVDWAGHANQSTRVVEEQYDFNRSIEAAVEWVENNSSWDETLIMVSADHETGYLAGPGAGTEAGWTELAGAEGELPNVSWHSGNHTNAIVPFYAHGAGSELLDARAIGWDKVRGAYLDNTDIGKVIFDLIGTPASDAEGDLSLEAYLSLPARGDLILSVDHDGAVISLLGDGGHLSGSLPAATVSDTRNDAQAQGSGWTLSGNATDFIAGNHTRTIEAENLSWTPTIVSSDGGASADAEAGRYGSTITLTLFAQD